MFLTCLLAFAIVVKSLPWNGVQPTHGLVYPAGQQEPPQPTQVPLGDLRARQAAGDAACGYFDGISSIEFYCLSHFVCATNSDLALGCCDHNSLDSCPLATTCIDNADLSNYSPAFLSNPYVAYCPETTLPYCVTLLFEYDAEATAYQCGSDIDDRFETFYTFITGANATLTSSITVYNAVFYLTTSESSSTSSSSSSSQEISPTPTPSTSSSTPAPPPASTTVPPSPSSSSSTPIGAIVGGSVGGAVAIAAVAGLIYFCRRRSRQQKISQPVQSGTVPMQQPPPQMVNYGEQPQDQSPFQPGVQPTTTVYSTGYPEKSAAGHSYSAYGPPPLSPHEPMVGGSERASTIAPPYSPQLSEPGSPHSAAPPQVSTIHELGAETRPAEL